jgi:hypothetical protein
VIAVGITIVLLISVGAAFLVFNREKISNSSPTVDISYPLDGSTVSGLVMISGKANDFDVNDMITVEVKIDEGKWHLAEGSRDWSFSWDTTLVENGKHAIYARAYDHKEYSDITKISVYVNNEDVTSIHKWALLVAACNFPEKEEQKLGNGGFYFALNLSKYLIDACGYPPEHITILFDDGWIRSDNGFGEKIAPLYEIVEPKSIHSGAATVSNFEIVLTNLIDNANMYDDSEVFIWLFNHGLGNDKYKFTGGKILESSAIFMWDGIIKDIDLGNVLSNLNAKKVCIIVDACYSGGFADKTIFNLPTILSSGISGKGRIVIAGTSKFKKGYADIKRGPLFSLFWFEGLTTGKADGYRPGLFKAGRRTILPFFKDGKVSVEEAFYYARCKLRSPQYLKYISMQPQINDQIPGETFL